LKNNIFEFSRTVDLNGVKPNKVLTEEIEANEDELEELIERLGVKEVKSFKSELKINKIPSGNYFQVFGTATAELVQSSVISGADVATTQISEFDAMFTLEYEVFNVEDSDEYEIDEDPYTPINRGVLDVGELSVQYLALDIDRYPKLEHEAFEDIEDTQEKTNAFSVLAKLKGDK